MTEMLTFLRTSQPTTCPVCGARTFILKESPEEPGSPQLHQCLDAACQFTFIEEEDLEDPELPV